MRILFLDDDFTRHETFAANVRGHDVDYVWTARDAITALSMSPEPFDIAFLDHDLDGKIYVPSGPGTGFEVAEFIASMPAERRPKKVVCHSYNEDGANLMMHLLRRAKCNSSKIPFGNGGYFGLVEYKASATQ